MVDKKKFQKNEEPLVREKMFNRHSFKLIHISEMDKIKETIVSLSLMRNYNEGRHGNWNNYCCLRKVWIQFNYDLINIHKKLIN